VSASRRSVNVPGYAHVNPIPAASRIGNLVMSSVISGRDAETGTMPEAIEDQCAHMFRTLQNIVEAAGGTTENVIKITVWLRDTNDRQALNAEWVKLFPDPASRPARHTLPLVGAGESLVQCDVIAVIDATV
jgi:enamine deaminase RidA (YjgF/YER057c/UK114 family)